MCMMVCPCSILLQREAVHGIAIIHWHMSLRLVHKHPLRYIPMFFCGHLPFPRPWSAHAPHPKSMQHPPTPHTAPTVITILEQDGATTMPWGPLSLPVPSSSSCLACMPSCRCLSWSCADCGGGRSTGCGGVVCWTCIAAALTQYGRRVKDMHNRE